MLREADSQVGFQGDFVVLDSAGRVRNCAPATTNVFDATTSVGSSVAGKLYGRVMRNLKNTTGAPVASADLPVERFDSQTQCYLPLYSATPANAAQSNVKVGDSFGLINVNGVLCVNVDATANPVVTIVGKSADLAPSARYEQVIIKVIEAQRAQ